MKDRTRKVRKRGEPNGALWKVFPKGAWRGNLLEVSRGEKVSQPDILMRRSPAVRFSNGARLALARLRHGWTVKQGEPTDGE